MNFDPFGDSGSRWSGGHASFPPAHSPRPPSKPPEWKPRGYAGGNAERGLEQAEKDLEHAMKQVALAVKQADEVLRKIRERNKEAYEG